MAAHSLNAVSRRHGLTQFVFCFLVALTLSAGAATARAECHCEPYVHPLPPEPQGQFEWGFFKQLGQGHEGRIAVFVATSLLPEVIDAIDTYADDLVDEGHRVVVVWVTNPRATDLREFCRDLYDEPASLTGTVFVGALPWVVMESEPSSGSDWPSDLYFMDLGIRAPDGGWIETWQDTDSNGKFDARVRSAPEIWMSRIKCDNLLPEITLSEAQVINAYFARNHAARTSTTSELFGNTQRGLVYEYDGSKSIPWLYDMASMLNAAEEVDQAHTDELTCRADYLARIQNLGEAAPCSDPEGDPVPIPGDYHFVLELSHGSHGGATSHIFDNYEGIYASHYLAEPKPTPVVYILHSCGPGEFVRVPTPAWPEGNLGPALAFDPDGAALLVLAYTDKASRTDYGPLWSRLGAGECFGEGFRECMSISPDAYNVVLLGDGSLKAKTFDWIGPPGTPENPQPWDCPQNWEGQTRPPRHGDRVRIGGANVLLDDGAGTPEIPAQVWSIALHEGANLSLQGGEQPAGLELAGSLITRPNSTASTLTLNPGSALTLPGAGARLSDIDVVMPDSEMRKTRLEVGGIIERVSRLAVGTNCSITAGTIRSVCTGTSDLLNGDLAAGFISDSELVLGPDAVVTATVIHHSTIDATVGTLGTPENPSVLLGCPPYSAPEWPPVFIGPTAAATFSSLSSSRVKVQGATVNGVPAVSSSSLELTDGASMATGEIGNSTLSVNSMSQLTAAASIRNSSFALSSRGSLSAPAGIRDEEPQPDEVCSCVPCTIDHATLTAGPVQIRRDWFLAGLASQAEWTADIGPLKAVAESGVTLQLSGGAKLRIQASSSQPEYLFPDLAAQSAPNRLLYGAGRNVLFGAGGSTSVHLNADSLIGRADGAPGALALQLESSLDIASEFEGTICEEWDTSRVDVQMKPVAAGLQTLEFISPDYSASFKGNAVVFMDLSCDGKWGALDLPQGTGEVRTADNHGNRPNPTLRPENGIFSTVTVGLGRKLKFTTPGVIYYYGSPPTGAGKVCAPDGTELAPPFWPVMRPAVASRFGDWDGSCTIVNSEMGRLQQAIAGGPSSYDPLLDADCDGVLSADVELARFLLNYANQPFPECGESLLGGSGESLLGGSAEREESELFAAGEDLEGSEPVDVEMLAAWLVEVLSPEDLDAFIAQATVTAAEHADEAVRAEMAELLSYLE
ncbi:MAG: hypothetical protein GX547_10955 [Phycisphaerae bacterium]|nr:hypothetical protein [Phycisphaerae bacterium]